MIDPENEGSGWGETEKETMTEPQEEFISEVARPSRDISEIRCERCGKPRADWPGEGVLRENRWYCSPECANEEAPNEG